MTYHSARCILLTLCITPLISAHAPRLHDLQSVTTAKLQIHNQLVTTIHEHAQDRENLLILLNVLYFSYLRSAMTLNIQPLQQAYQTEMLALGADVRATRRNPSKPFVASITHKQLLLDTKTYADAFDHYKTTAQTYAQCTEYALVQPQCSNAAFVSILKDIRAHTKSCVLKQVAIYYEIIKTVIHELSQIHHHKDLGDKDLLTTIYNALPQYAESGFVQFDKQYVQLRSMLDEFMLKNEQLYNTVWTAIEKERSSIYKELYTLCWNELKIIDQTLLGHNQLFDASGFVETTKKATLPLPTDLDVAHLENTKNV